ncbi:hypothetical protein MSAN_02468400 [Mycena sanguinolenta]|uniref:Uncharacterized protein n=1 Tax=Mycena sanguinolenta TaxID=230812 RepID=A0A8H6WTX2_9AGAR|nr:hypothetical protein MSAN_02468400 [Mycena sanguinolenta]
MSFSLLWPLGVVSSWLLLSFLPTGSLVDRIFVALATISVSWIFLAKWFQANNPSLYPRAGNSVEDISNDSDPDYHPSSPDDVFQVRRCLLNFLPPELVNTILDEAEYWPRIRSTRNQLLVVHASSSSDNNASLRCLVTPPFPASQALGGPSARLRVKRVKFDIVSNDQGWGGDPQDHGTYNGSYTWFEAAILRRAPQPEGRRLSPARPLFEVTNQDGCSRWLVQTNRCATVQAETHSIIWQADGMETASGHDREENGSGDGAGFIELLAPEDRIAIVARARFPGWVNCVRSVIVVVYYAV